MVNVHEMTISFEFRHKLWWRLTNRALLFFLSVAVRLGLLPFPAAEVRYKRAFVAATEFNVGGTGWTPLPR